jgi:hypothetical protein
MIPVMGGGRGIPRLRIETQASHPLPTRSPKIYFRAEINRLIGRNFVGNDVLEALEDATVAQIRKGVPFSTPFPPLTFTSLQRWHIC